MGNKKISPVGKALISAVRKLRTALGETQQGLANRLGIAISTMVRYESSRPPSGKTLSLFARLAEDSGQTEIAAIFREALKLELGDWELEGVDLALEPRTPIERLWVSAILSTLRNSEYAHLIPNLAHLLKEPAQNSIKILEHHKMLKSAQSLIEAGTPPEQVSKAFNIPIERVRLAAFGNELKRAYEQAEQWAKEDVGRESK